MDWKPKPPEAVSWLLDDMFGQEIRKQIPNAELHLAGKNMPRLVILEKNQDKVS